MAAGHFDETDLKSFYFKDVKHEDACAILKDEEEGVFLLRDSSRAEGYVVCVKECKTVMQYAVCKNETGKIFIRPEFIFNDISSLLSFYKRNTFTTCALLKPIAKEKVRFHLTHGEHAGERPMTMIEPPTQHTPITARRQPKRASEPCPPLYVRVTNPRTPISYDQAHSLSLVVGDVIRVTKRSNGQGYGEIVSSGKVGHFPLTHVEVVQSIESLELEMSKDP